MKKAILYINQFFGQIGGEEKAGVEPEIHEGQIGPAVQFAKELDAKVTHTIICGDNYMGSHTDAAVSAILEMLKDKEMDLFLAGPAFQAGRYGVACGTICKAVQAWKTRVSRCLKKRCISSREETAQVKCVPMSKQWLKLQINC